MRRQAETSRGHDICGWRTDSEIGRYFVPGCMGGAVYGPGGCTCGARVRPTSERLADLEAQVADLTARLALAEREARDA